VREIANELLRTKDGLAGPGAWLFMFELTTDDWEGLYYDQLTVDFNEEDTVTGGTSSASATIKFVVPTSDTEGCLIISGRGATNFQDNEPITDSRGGSAKVTAPLPDGEFTFRRVKNTENITFDSNEYTAISMTMDPFLQEKESVPAFRVSIGNVDQVMEGYVQKAQGFRRKPCRILLVHSDNLTEEPVIDETFDVMSVECTNEYVTFVLGTRNPFLDFFPRFVYDRKVCRFEYGSVECGHSGASCDKTFASCLSLVNQARFGGFPAIPGGRFDA